jgi:hypothetical protein
LAESCLAKSLACHHSRNFKKNIDVGRRILRESRILGRIIRVRIVGERREAKVRGLLEPRLRALVELEAAEAAAKARY